MDGWSHRIFAGILLEAVNKNTKSLNWAVAPDIDLSFLHRWYRHRISVLPEIYDEFSAPKDVFPDYDAITLCVVSHLYLDIFNGWVFPFGLWHPIYPKKTLIAGVLEDIDDPKLLVKELKMLVGDVAWSKAFYAGSRDLMVTFASNWQTSEDIVAAMVYRLARYASGENRFTSSDSDNQTQVSLFNKAMNDIIASGSRGRENSTPSGLR
jgi:hypothetical protein